MQYQVWDKKSNINNCPAETYLDNHPEIGNGDEIVLVSGDNGAVMYVENATMLRGQLGLAADVDAVTVVTTHMEKIAEDNAKAASTPSETEQLKQKMADIEFALMINNVEV